MKSKKELIDNKLKNPIYLNILYAMGDDETYLSEFGRKFSKRLNKSRPCLFYQIMGGLVKGRKVTGLYQDGYIKKRTKGKKVFFRVNWYKVHIDYKKMVNDMTMELNKKLKEQG